jgi:hypothetical protein
VLGARVSADVYGVIAKAAKASGRNMSEELIWRALQSFTWQTEILELKDQLLTWQRAHKDAQTMLANAKLVTEGGIKKQLEDELRLRGYHFVRGARLDDPHYGAWFPPGVDSVIWIYETSTGHKLLESMVSRAADAGAERALGKLIGRAAKPEGEKS